MPLPLRRPMAKIAQSQRLQILRRLHIQGQFQSPTYSCFACKADSKRFQALQAAHLHEAIAR